MLSPDSSICLDKADAAFAWGKEPHSVPVYGQFAKCHLNTCRFNSIFGCRPQPVGGIHPALHKGWLWADSGQCDFYEHFCESLGWRWCKGGRSNGTSRRACWVWKARSREKWDKWQARLSQLILSNILFSLPSKDVSMRPVTARYVNYEVTFREPNLFWHSACWRAVPLELEQTCQHHHLKIDLRERRKKPVQKFCSEDCWTDFYVCTCVLPHFNLNCRFVLTDCCTSIQR